jgi:hypothetical protein
VVTFIRTVVTFVRSVATSRIRLDVSGPTPT